MGYMTPEPAPFKALPFQHLSWRPLPTMTDVQHYPGPPPGVQFAISNGGAVMFGMMTGEDAVNLAVNLVKKARRDELTAAAIQALMAEGEGLAIVQGGLVVPTPVIRPG